jgi:quercetin dioxygenase-like cupin family protein
MKLNYFTLLFGILFSLEVHSQQHNQANENVKPIQICESDLKWSDTKPPLLPGAKVAVVEGNPKTTGHFTLRIKFPPYYKIPPHTHPVDERTLVLKGVINIGFGDVLDTTNAKRLTPGCFYLNPAGVHHYFFTSAEETEIQISTNGPWGLDLVGEK